MDFATLKITLASPEQMLEWSYGEVTKAETINYRTQKPEKEGLFSEAIFGPTKDWECYCGKYRRIRYKGIICDRCGVEVTRSIVRRERMGHITLAAPVAHIWFLRGIPSRIASILDVSLPELERVIYFAAYIVTSVNTDLKTEAMKRLEDEFRSLLKNETRESEQEKLKEQRDREKESLKNLKKYQILPETVYQGMSVKYGEVFEAGIGAEAVRKLLEEISLDDEVKRSEDQLKIVDNPVTQKKLMRRVKLLKGLGRAGLRPEWMIMNILPIIPPLLRPMVPLDGGRFATSDLNDLYRRVINRNNRLKHLLELRAPQVITKNEKRMLQEAVDALIDNSMRRGQTLVSASTGQKRALKSLADMLKGKQGRFRQNLLGKRVDYSGRSVIVIGPTLKMDECGIPKYMALELFKPFIIHYLIEKGLAHNIRSANHLIDQETPEVWEALEFSIQNKLVLLNRAPTLHRLSVQAFKPKLIEGKAIKIPAMPVHAFNADFDGDQMAVHLPLTDEAQKEARELMLSTHGILKPSTGDPVAIASHDISFGCYYITSVNLLGALGDGKIFSSESEAIMALDHELIDIRANVKIIVSKDVKGSDTRFIETSVGRAIFNRALPEDYPFLNKVINKTDLREIEADILARYGEDRCVEFLDKIQELGFHYATVSGVSWGMDDVKIPPEKAKMIADAEKIIHQNVSLYEQGLLTEYERKSKAIEIWTGVKSNIEKVVRGQFNQNDSIFMMVDSKSRGNWGTVNQLAGMRGLMVKPDGELIELPVKSSFKEGLNVLEYFISTHGARKGLVDTALRTASAGYLTRRLVDVAQDIVIQEEDCKDKEGFIIFSEDNKFTGENFFKRVLGRVPLEDIKDKDGTVIAKKNHVIETDTARAIVAVNPTTIKFRSPITCKSRSGLCQLCYGHDLSNHLLVKIGQAVGIVTAQAIGEPGTQLTMRTFHTGGVASVGDITMGLPRVEEIFEVRPPSGKAIISEVDGTVTSVEQKGNQFVIKILSDKAEEREYLTLPGANTLVSAGDLIITGQQLSDGHIDLRELFKTSGNISSVARYVVREVQSVYYATGEGINEKHIELIIRQMFSRIRVIDAGDTDLLPGDTLEKRTVLEANDAMKEDDKKPATFEQLLLGITKVSLSTDSYLSAASFQETARVLIDAAISGKADKLRGLKENVIIGRLIPAGTGYNIEPTIMGEVEGTDQH
ncbi:MAG: DNA-directed RNA polymerase subunit beta' [Candidatus Yanofskybacteria bacterium RIFCSPLOWO2_01_FULL_49_25]|uniref:DNA-directed RNA polymerase subunit beta' n=1 Tax=Candidatus Yanofskybacteria bacterium RIFCSPLOWO2_01_FULL_49_25 TaxID=1802701 RepID=A0A1F8GUT7_9BACT|nr:MAG: DNA-directed RNA polymerase subunit beta' [Candidatus Yanofskybacteria bacterium RIFCSPLOWO2_01_FULL_49_25]